MEPAAPIKTLGSKIVYQNPWITIHEDKTLMPSGKEGIYGYLESKDSVNVVVFDDQDRIYMAKSFRYPTKSWGWELPGGSSDGEDLLQASKRELEEEAGIIAEQWELVGKNVVCDGLMTERMATCIAYDIRFDGTKENGDEQFADTGFFTLEEIDQMVDNGDINDGQTITGLYLAKRWLARREKQ